MNASLALTLAYWHYGLFPQTLNYSKWDLKAHWGLSFRLRPQFSSVTQSCLSLCDPMDCSFLELTQTLVHQVGDAFQLSHPLLSPSTPAFNLSQHQDLLQWVSSLGEAAKVLEFQLQHQSFHWIFRTDFLYNGLVGSPCSPRDSQMSFPP